MEIRINTIKSTKMNLLKLITLGTLMTITVSRFFSQGFDQVEIQAQDESGNWRTYIMTQNNSQLILQNMKQLRWQFPDKRIRAIDQKGRAIDFY
jgi:hypothetical protein